MHSKVIPSLTRFYCIIAADTIPNCILQEDYALRRSASEGGNCFAQVVRQTHWATYQIVVAADPHYLHDDKRSYVIHVPASALPAEARVIHLSAAAIPEVLLSEDQELRQIADQNGKCPAFVEYQLTWDLYRVRIASKTYSLCDEDRSHAIYLSQAEMQAYITDVPEQEVVAPAADGVSSSLSTKQKLLDITALEPILVSEEELNQAANTVDIPLEVATKTRQSHNAKLTGRLWHCVELVLYRALLRALEWKKELQELVRRVLVSRRQFNRRLISIRGMYEIDHHAYWSIQVHVPAALI